MTVPLPWTFSKDDPSGPDLEDRLQETFDKLATQFPVSGANLANDVLKLAVTGTSRSISFVSVTGLAAMGGANRKQFTIAHGGTTTPVAWVLANSFIAAASTSTAQNEVVDFGRVSEDATNVVAQGVLTNGATAAVGPGNTFLVVVF